MGSTSGFSITLRTARIGRQRLDVRRCPRRRWCRTPATTSRSPTPGDDDQLVPGRRGRNPWVVLACAADAVKSIAIGGRSRKWGGGRAANRKRTEPLIWGQMHGTKRAAAPGRTRRRCRRPTAPPRRRHRRPAPAAGVLAGGSRQGRDKKKGPGRWRPLQRVGTTATRGVAHRDRGEHSVVLPALPHWYVAVPAPSAVAVNVCG